MKWLCAIVLVACAACLHTPSFSSSDAESIMRPLAYEQEIDRKCQSELPASDADKFLNELNGHVATSVAALLSSIAKEVSEGEAEYVCTVELFDSTQQRADEARALWKTLKGQS